LVASEPQQCGFSAGAQHVARSAGPQQTGLELGASTRATGTCAGVVPATVARASGDGGDLRDEVDKESVDE
jgi:hypothetical protein